MDQSLLPNIYDFISHTHPFSLLSTIEKDAMATSIKIVYYAKDDIIRDESLCSTGLFMIRTGALEQINNDGSLRCRLGVGDSFGFTQLKKSGKSDYSVHFLENTLLYLVSKQMLDFLISKNEKIAQYFDSHEWVRLSSTHNISEMSDNGINKGFMQKVCAFVQKDIAIMRDTDSIQNTAIEIGRKNSDLAFIKRKDDELCGVVTKSDLALRVVAKGTDINQPISSIMTLNPVCIDINKSLFAALDLMISYNLKSLGVTDGGRLVGSIGASQLLLNSQLQSIFLLKNINKAQNLETLKALSVQKEEIFITLVSSGLEPTAIERVMTRIADAFYTRIAKLTEQKLGQSPCPYAIMVAGSQARNEIHLLSDQDNAIIVQDKLNDNDMAYFHTFANILCKSLDECGYKLCSGNYMAANKDFCVPYSTFEQYYYSWICEATEKKLLNSIVFMDIRYVYGDEFLISKLKNYVSTTIAQNSRFLSLMALCSLSVSPPLGLFRQFVLTKDGDNREVLDIKKNAVALVVELGRIYALKAGSKQTDTISRLNDACEAGILSKEDLRELCEAYSFINKVRFSHQILALNKGEKLSNTIDPKSLSQFERNHLKDAFRIIAKHQEAASFRFKGGF